SNRFRRAIGFPSRRSKSYATRTTGHINAISLLPSARHHDSTATRLHATLPPRIHRRADRRARIKNEAQRSSDRLLTYPTAADVMGCTANKTAAAKALRAGEPPSPTRS